MSARQQVFSAINGERAFQDRKWGPLEEHPHEVGAWLTIMRQLLNDAERAYMTQSGDAGALDELRKVVSVGVACMEQHGPIPRKAADLAQASESIAVAQRVTNVSPGRPALAEGERYAGVIIGKDGAAATT